MVTAARTRGGGGGGEGGWARSRGGYAPVQMTVLNEES
jgi:hypothetical protein